MDHGKSSFQNLSEEDQNKLVGRFMRLMLVKNVTKLPVRRDEINKALGTEYGRVGRLFNETFRIAEQQLKNIFGFKIVEVRKSATAKAASQASQRRTQTQSSQGGGSGQRSFILVNALPPDLRPEPSKKAIFGLIAVVAGIIILTPGGKVRDEDLWTYLAKVGINKEHDQLGNVQTLLEKDLVSQMYFERFREGDASIFTLGARFHQELEEENVLKIIEGVYGSVIDSTSRKELLIALRGLRDDEEIRE